VGPGGVDLRTGPLPYAVPGRPVEIAVVVRSAAPDPCAVRIADETVALPPGGTDVVVVRVDHATPELRFEVDGAVAAPVPVAEAVPAGRLRLRSSRSSRWSVADDRGDAWFPEGVLRKWDAHGRPWFHGADVELEVPAGTLQVRTTRGMEHHTVDQQFEVAAGRRVDVSAEPGRWYDAAAAGWFGADLHVHLNYSGDHVATPADAAAMQDGEALHVLHLVAGNQSTARVYDVEAFEHWAGADLPWSADAALARWGVEYRNDLYGHLHAFGSDGPPSRYHSGHPRSDHPADWPPNAVACEELASLGATIGYTHPILGSAITADSPAAAFAVPRSCEARELVADAALGLVDSVDLIGPASTDGPTILYHRLLNTGLRLTASAGTDTMLSMARVGPFSNPPGWARVYAHLGAGRPTADGWKEAIRAGRTFVTNGPWVELTVDAAGPGDVLDLAAGERLVAWARCTGPGIEAIRLVGPDGTLAETTAEDGTAEVHLALGVDEPTWIAAVVDGRTDPAVLYGTAFAHTTPVYVDVDGRRIGRAQDARWCLEWLDRFEALAGEHGTYDDPSQLQDLVDVLDRARSYYGALVEA